MRVLLLTTDAFGGHGGIALYNRDVVEALVAMPDVEEVVVIPRNMPFAPDGIPGKVSFLTQAVGSKWRFITTALTVAGSYQFIICGHINLLPLAAMMSFVLRVPLVLMVYGIDVWQKPYSFAVQWLRCIDAIWSISAITRDKMNIWAKMPDSKFILMPNAIHLDRYGLSAKREELLQRHGLSGYRVIMTLARLPSMERYKGVDEVLEVMPMLLAAEPKLKYLVVGDGNDRSRLEAKAKTMGLAEHVVFTGLIDEAEKADYFRLADAFVMPGRGEGFGFVYLEALACGVPVVGSRIDGSREALLDGQLGELADPLSLSSIRDAILAALAKPKEIPPGLDYFAWPSFAARLAQAVRQIPPCCRK